MSIKSEVGDGREVPVFTSMISIFCDVVIEITAKIYTR